MTTLRFEHVFKKFRQRHTDAPDGDLWALSDINFECREGEVLGLVGRNGCGKSTLLKLAAHVTSPTTGKVTCVKEVAPMLELGAGFHPDLTGRDNIKLNGSLLGLGRNISPGLLDQIVSFAEIEEHLDTPVKHYSSGMYARLGFAVAVHSPARLLLVDEVLSVGDKLFRQRCLTRMQQLRDQGTTIVLVSHDDWWIRHFSTRALLLSSGRVVMDSTPEQVLEAYDAQLHQVLDSRQDGVAITQIQVLNPAGEPIGELAGSSAKVRILYNTEGTSGDWLLVARVRRCDGVYCATSISERRDHKRTGEAVIELANLHLTVGRYVVEVSIEDAKTLEPLVTHASEMFYVEGNFDINRGFDGIIQLNSQWSFD